MGIIQKQGLKSSIYIILGFAIGAINLIVLSTTFLTQTQIGLTRAVIDTSTTLVALCSLGSMNLIYKFQPYYKDYLSPKKNDLPIITFILSVIGFSIVALLCYTNKDFIIRKLGKSPELANYFFLIFPYTFLVLIYSLLEAFAWGIHKTTLTNFLKETLVRLLTMILILLFGLKVIGFNTFMSGFSLLYLLPVIIVATVLIKSGKWSLNFIRISSVTRRLKKKMFTFGMFVMGGHFLSVLARTNDTILLFGLKGLTEVAVFSYSLYIIAVMDIPFRSLGITTPVLAQSWKDKDMKNISNIYTKSVTNLLVVGLAMFGLIWLNIHNLAFFLSHILSKGKQNYDMIEPLVLILGIAKVIDLGTGVNGNIIGTSNLWRFDFFTNVFNIVLSIPLNYLLIKHFGMIGLALSNLGALVIYNSVRYWVLWNKFDLQPYNWGHLKLILLCIIIYILIYFIPHNSNIYFDTIIRTITFSSLYLLLIYKTKIAPDIIQIIEKQLAKLRK